MITKRNNLRSNLDFKNIKRKFLSIQFSLDGFSFCIFDLELQEFVLFNEYTFDDNEKSNNLLNNIKQVFINEAILKATFEKVLVVHVNNLSAFVPYPLFDEDYLENYIQFNNKTYKSDFFEYDFILNQDMVSVFVPYVHVNNFLIDQFGSFEYKHYSSVLVENLLNNHSSKSAINFFIHVGQSHFEIIVAKHKKLLLYNTFLYKTTEDFIYYVLFTIEQLDLDVEKVEVQLLGQIENFDEFYKILYKYIRHVSFLDYQSNYNSILSIDKYIQTKNFIIFNTID